MLIFSGLAQRSRAPPPRACAGRAWPFARDEVLELRIAGLTNLGEGVGRVRLDEREWVVMVPFALPGELVRARVIRNHKRHSTAELDDVLVASAARKEPVCPLFQVCGGCQYQHLEYAEQLRWKRKQVLDALGRVGGLRDLPLEQLVAPTIGSPREYGYRSKLTPHYQQHGVTASRAVGFVRRGAPDEIVDVPHCPIASDALNMALPAAREAVRSQAADEGVGSGGGDGGGRGGGSGRGGGRGRRRRAVATSSLLLRDAREGVVSAPDQRVTEVVAGSDDGLTPTLTFSFRAGDFFQNNPHALPRLVRHVVAQACAPLGSSGDGEDESDGDSERPAFLIDAYSGSGLFALSAAGLVESVVGVETCETAVACATANAASNGVTNARFVAASAEAIFAQLPPSLVPARTVAVLDPPRRGCDAAFLCQLLRFAPQRIVYISCEPATQARDLQVLVGAGYALTLVQPVDLFPQTRHCETVATLEWPGEGAAAPDLSFETFGA